jgi:diguanylate cyclase (GGDEF)-like protein
MKTPFNVLESIYYEKKQVSESDLFSLFDAAQIPKEACWRTIYRMIFDVKFNVTSSPEQKITRLQLESIMKKALKNAKENAFSESHLLDLIEDYNAVTFSVCHSRLSDVLTELDSLTKEFKSMSEKKSGTVKKLESDTISAVQSNLSLDEKVKLIKSGFKETINMFQEDLVKLDQMSHTDHLTGLHNRRFFDDRLDMEVAQALKEKTWLNLLMIDIDDFKQFNDTYGHPIGDQALKTISKNIGLVCSDESQKTGIDFFPARYGGEEFCIILPAIDGKQALDIAQMIQTKISNYMFVLRDKKGQIRHEDIKLTVSIGMASLNHQYNKKQGTADLLENADSAMFEAKKAGKNTIKTRTTAI